MSRSNVAVAVIFAGAFGALCCVGSNSNDDSETAVLALGGTTGCQIAGTNGGFTDTPGVHGFTRSDGVHEAVFRVAGTSDIKQSSGTPLGSPVAVASGALATSNAWGYQRHDGPNTILYIDQNGHPHEVGSVDFDFTVSFGINAPIAAAGDIIGYVRSDAKSGMVYRSSNKHVIELTSNFSGSPPWLANDLTTIAGVPLSAIGNAFPYVRSDGASAIVYRANDNHIHELSNTGPAGWSDSDLHAISQETILAASDPWGYKRSDNRNNVLFVGADSKLHEFVLTSNDWISVLLPAIQPVNVVRPSGYVGPTGVNSVVYITRGSLQPLHQLTLSGTTWTDQALLVGACVSPLSEPFGHTAPGGRSSILFLGRDSTSANRYELSRSTGSWTLATF